VSCRRTGRAGTVTTALQYSHTASHRVMCLDTTEYCTLSFMNIYVCIIIIIIIIMCSSHCVEEELFVAEY
jgi:hypothetical protein